MNILVINQRWFIPELTKMGHIVKSCGTSSDHDFVLDNFFEKYSVICQSLFNGKEPDVVVVYDNSSAIQIDELYEANVPIVFLSIDAHHHFNLHCTLLPACDAFLVAQSDYIESFRDVSPITPVEWFPLWAEKVSEAPPIFDFDVSFVGTLNPKLNSERVKFFDALSKRVKINIGKGHFGEIFRKSRIVINQTVKGDLNFRVFETMATGAFLLTEDTGNGLKDIFVPDRHLGLYRKGDVEAATSKIEYWLSHEKERAEVAAAGREEVLNKHLAIHRAQRLHELLSTIQVSEKRNKFYAWALNFIDLGERLWKVKNVLAVPALFTGFKLVERACGNNEILNERQCSRLIGSAVAFDLVTKAKIGDTLIDLVLKAYPSLKMPKIAKIKRLIDQKEIEQATALARNLSEQDPELVFEIVQGTMRDLMNYSIMGPK